MQDITHHSAIGRHPWPWGFDLHKIAGRLGLWLQRIETRRSLKELEPHRLADIGIGESERRHETRKWFWQE